MIYIIECWDRKDQKRVLKGFDKTTPVYVLKGQFNKGAPVQEFARTDRALAAAEKIKAAHKWRHIDIIKLV